MRLTIAFASLLLSAGLALAQQAPAPTADVAGPQRDGVGTSAPSQARDAAAQALREAVTGRTAPAGVEAGVPDADASATTAPAGPTSADTADADAAAPAAPPAAAAEAASPTADAAPQEAQAPATPPASTSQVTPGGSDAAAPTAPAAAQAPPPAAATAAGETADVPPGERVPPRPLTIGLLDDAPPFSSAARYGVRAGFDVDLAYGVCGRLERRCRFLPMERSELTQALRDRRIDAVIASDGRSETFDAIADFTEPYLSLAARFVVPRGTASDLESENATAYGAVIGTPHAQYLQTTYKDPSSVALYASSEEMWIDLALGRLEGALATAVTARLEFLDTPLGGPFRFATGTLAEANVRANNAAIAVRKGDAALLQQLNAALNDYMGSADYNDALNRHLTGGLAIRPTPAGRS